MLVPVVEAPCTPPVCWCVLLQSGPIGQPGHGRLVGLVLYSCLPTLEAWLPFTELLDSEAAPVYLLWAA
jgi:hypothetical protein